jgi:queuine tRNA-ribosyltransferase
MSELACEVVTTTAGATAIRDRTTGEVMHPVVGPLVESMALYVEPSELGQRLAEPSDTPLVLLDVGLGAGSNALAALKAASLPGAVRRLALVSFDRSRNAFDLARSAGHGEAFGFDAELGARAAELVERGTSETDRISWRLVLGELPGTLEHESSASADIVFWDPFSPRANPELWDLTAFSAVRRLCREAATLHTYSSATFVRAALLLAGFAVGAGPVTASGRASTVASPDLERLAAPLERRWFERLSRSSLPFPADAPKDALARIRGLAQFV